MTAGRRAEVAFDDNGVLGEGPVWDAPTGSLWWTDVHRRRLLRGDGATGRVTVHQLPGSVASFVLRPDGTLMSARRGQVVTYAPGGEFTQVGTLPGRAETSAQVNDGKCDPLGRFWVGSISRPVESRAGALWRIDGDFQAETMLTEVAISNGMGWTADGGTLYYIDSLDQAIDQFSFDLDSGTLHGRRRLTDVPMAHGLPDGLAVDTDGGVWVAMFFAGRVHRYTPDGTLDTVVELPVPCVASVAFGGADLATLYITTGQVQKIPMAGRFGVEVPSSQPLAGCVFACQPGPTGVPVSGFAA